MADKILAEASKLQDPLITEARTKEIEDILGALWVAWMRHPHLRLGQIIDTVLVSQDVFFVRDADMLETFLTMAKADEVKG